MAFLALRTTRLLTPVSSASRLANSDSMITIVNPLYASVKRSYMDHLRPLISQGLNTPEFWRSRPSFNTNGFKAIAEDLRFSFFARQDLRTGLSWSCRAGARGYSQHKRKQGDIVEITRAEDVQVPVPSVEEKPSMVVSVFWDLDNKPPKDVPAFDAARRLREAASTFGHVVDFIAYANHHAFDFVPQWVREERRERKALDLEEKLGLHVPDKPYVCGVCGHKFATNIKLKKHFQQLHERERNKRMNRMNAVSPKRRQKIKEANAVREKKYQEAVKGILVPKRGYGLASDIKRAGVFVKTVQDKPQAADLALKSDMMKAIRSGVHCICLVSDDMDFSKDLDLARSRRLRTVVIGNGSRLSNHADIFLSWADISSGRARRMAWDAVSDWSEEDDLVGILEDDEIERAPRPAFMRDGRLVRDEWDYSELEMEAVVSQGRRVSPFSEDEEEMWDDDSSEHQHWDGDDEDDDDDDEDDDDMNLGKDSVVRRQSGHGEQQRGQREVLRWWEVESGGVGTKN